MKAKRFICVRLTTILLDCVYCLIEREQEHWVDAVIATATTQCGRKQTNIGADWDPNKSAEDLADAAWDFMAAIDCFEEQPF